MKHFLKAGMKPDLNAHWNVCQSQAAWQGGLKTVLQDITRWSINTLVLSSVRRELSEFLPVPIPLFPDHLTRLMFRTRGSHSSPTLWFNWFNSAALNIVGSAF